MQAVKAVYKEGNIHLLTPLVGVNEAELFVIVMDKDDQRRCHRLALLEEISSLFHDLADFSKIVTET